MHNPFDTIERKQRWRIMHLLMQLKLLKARNVWLRVQLAFYEREYPILVERIREPEQSNAKTD